MKKTNRNNFTYQSSINFDSELDDESSKIDEEFNESWKVNEEFNAIKPRPKKEYLKPQPAPSSSLNSISNNYIRKSQKYNRLCLPEEDLPPAIDLSTPNLEVNVRFNDIYGLNNE